MVFFRDFLLEDEESESISLKHRSPRRPRHIVQSSREREVTTANDKSDGD